jgi:hypothetical protein
LHRISSLVIGGADHIIRDRRKTSDEVLVAKRARELRDALGYLSDKVEKFYLLSIFLLELNIFNSIDN